MTADLKKGQIRRVSQTGDLFLVLREDSGMIPLVPLTDKLELAKVRETYTPLISTEREGVLAPLPFWTYGSPELVAEISEVVEEISEEELRVIGNYLMEAPLIGASEEANEFIRETSRRWRSLLLHAVENLYQRAKESPP